MSCDEGDRLDGFGRGRAIRESYPDEVQPDCRAASRPANALVAAPDNAVAAAVKALTLGGLVRRGALLDVRLLHVTAAAAACSEHALAVAAVAAAVPTPEPKGFL